MMPMIQDYVDLILKERSWSWAVVCLLYVLAALFVRSWFIGGLFTQLKMLEKKHAARLKAAYLRNSLLGWLFFLLPNLLIILDWRKSSLPFPVNEKLILAIGSASFIFSILLHLQAFASACLHSFESAENAPKPSDI